MLVAAMGEQTLWCLPKIKYEKEKLIYCSSLPQTLCWLVEPLGYLIWAV